MKFEFEPVPFVARDSATNDEPLCVQRNASRWIKALTRFGFIPAVA